MCIWKSYFGTEGWSPVKVGLSECKYCQGKRTTLQSMPMGSSLKHSLDGHHHSQFPVSACSSVIILPSDFWKYQHGRNWLAHYDFFCWFNFLFLRVANHRAAPLVWCDKEFQTNLMYKISRHQMMPCWVKVFPPGSLLNILGCREKYVKHMQLSKHWLLLCLEKTDARNNVHIIPGQLCNA